MTVPVVTITSNESKVSAKSYETYPGNPKNSNGITNQKFWPYGDTTEWQKKAINDMIYNWNSSYNQNVWTPMNLSYTKNKGQSIVDFYYVRDLYDRSSVTGKTTFWNWNNNVNHSNGSPFSNWSSATIKFGGKNWSAGTLMFDKNIYGNRFKYATISHEIGHAMGLTHNNDFGYMTIMRSDLSKIPDKMFGPWFNDLYGINSLYK